MDNSVSFGAGKAGVAFDPIAYITRPQVILRFFCWVFSVIVYFCIRNKGWIDGRCSYNGSGNACRFGTLLGLVGLTVSIALLIIEALFQNISSIKVRRRVVAADLLFSGLWSVLYFICFAYLGITWSKSKYPEFGYGIDSIRSAIAFCFFSIFVWAGCAYFAWLKWKSGTDMSVFAPSYEEGGPPPGADYYAHSSGIDGTDPNYQDQGIYSSGPVNDQYIQAAARGNFQPPTY